MFWGHDRNLWANDWATFILAFDWAWIKGYNIKMNAYAVSTL